MPMKEFYRQQARKKIALVLILLVAFGLLGAWLYPKYNFTQQTGLPISKMFTSYEKQPIISGGEQNTPNKATEAILEDNPKEQSVIYVFYKVGCSTCQAEFSQVKAAINNYQGAYPVYWVNVQSDLGQKLVEKYNVEHASSVVVVNQAGKGKLTSLNEGMSKEAILATLNESME